MSRARLPIFQYALTELFDRRDGRRAHGRRLPGDGRRAWCAQPARGRLVPSPHPRRAGGRSAAVPAAGDDHRARRLGATASAGIGDRLVGRRRGHDGVGHRPTRPASVPGVRPRPQLRGADGGSCPRSVALGMGSSQGMDRGWPPGRAAAGHARRRGRRVGARRGAIATTCWPETGWPSTSGGGRRHR